VVKRHLHLVKPGGQRLLARGLHDEADFPFGQVKEGTAGPHGRITPGRPSELVQLLALPRPRRHRVTADELRNGRSPFDFQVIEPRSNRKPAECRPMRWIRGLAPAATTSENGAAGGSKKVKVNNTGRALASPPSTGVPRRRHAGRGVPGSQR